MTSRNKTGRGFGRGTDRRTFLRNSGTLAGGLLLGQRFDPALAQGAGPAAGAAAAAGPIVDTAAGKLRGTAVDHVAAFKGIPYGASTAGAARFMPPVKPAPWSGVRDALELGERAPQGGKDLMFVLYPTLERPEPEGEDCLRLNVWTRSVGAGKRPVMVWLHGGGYMTGSGGLIAYDGANLARKEDVVVVTLNHRLNVFGFLFLAGIGGDKYAHSANLGMQDIVLALEWVRDNIAGFGGDPGNVTIFGQSGGGGKVSTLLAMPSAKGLFHRAIIESGSTVKQSTLDEAGFQTQAFLTRLNLKNADELQALPLERIRAEMAASMRAPPPAPGAKPGFSLPAVGPVVDGHYLPANPFDPVAPAMSADVPLLVGSNEDEITFFPWSPFGEIDDATLHAKVKGMLHADDAGADAVIAAYRKPRPGATPLDVLQALSSDMFLRGNLHTQVERKVALGRAPVYVYYFNWRSPVQGGRLKASHCMEIPFVFRNLDSMQAMIGDGADRQALADRMSGAWAAFARSGNPNLANAARTGMPHWPAYEAGTKATLVINDHPKVVNDPDGAERAALAALMKPAPKTPPA